jgi:methionine aminopeptidase
VEHRLLSPITSNSRRQPLVSHEVIINLIAGTTTRSGLTVHAELTGHRFHRMELHHRAGVQEPQARSYALVIPSRFLRDSGI